MNALVLRYFVFTMDGWINRGQQQVIEDLLEENRILREQPRGRKLRLTDAQRRRLAVRAKALGRKASRESDASALRTLSYDGTAS